MDSPQSHLDTWQGFHAVEAPRTGWQGIQAPDDSKRITRTALAAGAVYEAHHLALKYLPNYAGRAYDFARAAEAFAGLVREHPDDGPAAYLMRCAEIYVAAPPEGWDGVIVMESK